MHKTDETVNVHDVLAVVDVFLCDALIVDEHRIHCGHFSSDERVNAVQDSRQVSKLQLLWGTQNNPKHSQTSSLHKAQNILYTNDSRCAVRRQYTSQHIHFSKCNVHNSFRNELSCYKYTDVINMNKKSLTFISICLFSEFWNKSLTRVFPSSEEPFSWENLYFQMVLCELKISNRVKIPAKSTKQSSQIKSNNKKYTREQFCLVIYSYSVFLQYSKLFFKKIKRNSFSHDDLFKDESLNENVCGRLFH